MNLIDCGAFRRGLFHLFMLCTGIYLPLTTFAQEVTVTLVHPPFWWQDMVHHRIELLVYGQQVALSQVTLDHPGAILHGVTRTDNPNYVFLDVEFVPGEIQVGEVPIVFTYRNKSLVVAYQIQARKSDNKRIQGIGPEDLIYLIMPDRFANGDPNNDVVAGMQEPTIDRNKALHRHGGDIQGIIDHLDYIDSLGVTALWLNPIEINDQPKESYHGYAITDHYQVDPRLGSIALYQALVDSCHARGIKVIRDVIYNHVGDQHWFIQDLPSRDWVNQWPEFTKTTYRAPVLMDPYAAEADKQLMSDGWFDTHMPDLNQQNKHVATYLIQNSLWWIEFFGLDGYRIDTYAYPDQSFMADLNAAILAEYPQFSIFAETWVHGVPIQAWFTEKIDHKSIDSHLPGVTDFQLYYAVNDALTQAFGWTEGLARLYYTLAKDYVYHDPSRNVIFLDNHDLGRFASTIRQDLSKFNMGIGFLLTTRGIPQVYYGTEIFMPNSRGRIRDDRYREEFSGGWPGDKVDKFTAAGRNKEEEEAFQFFQKLALYRKQSAALTQGKLMQFVPEEGVYVYFRYTDEQSVMVMLNQNDQEQTITTNRYVERLSGFTKGKNVITDQTDIALDKIILPGKSITILELY